MWVRLVLRNFPSIGAPGWECGPKNGKFPLFGTDSPRRGEPLTDFFIVRRFYTLRMFSYPAYVFKLEAIRFTGYGVIAEKTRVGHLPVPRNFPCTL